MVFSVGSGQGEPGGDLREQGVRDAVFRGGPAEPHPFQGSETVRHLT
jgi:hypothetical protein